MGVILGVVAVAAIATGQRNPSGHQGPPAAGSLLLAHVVDEPVPVSSPKRCLRALLTLSPNEVPSPKSFERTECPSGGVSAAFRYDRVHGTSRTSRAVSEGEIVRAFPEFGTDLVLPGDVLHLVIVSGFVRIERQVEAMQSARSGQRLFVKGQNGEILSVLYKSDVQ